MITGRQYNPYANGYRAAYSHAVSSHNGYRYILAIIQEHWTENGHTKVRQIAGLLDGCFMGARDRGRKKAPQSSLGYGGFNGYDDPNGFPSYGRGKY